ncbi:uncharacterized protein LOC117572545 [Drosophila albomicans]|uniref:Uncharacterized protein LOC117572545 n=1 Tax=Drosophila albomicans TaxID=7291 RepID=A0A6P8XFS9_DROAB|nr:uncharacterized protein LOC117572545 [Drosophila albomicans]
MQLRRQEAAAGTTLTTLNDDCLLLICGQIPIRDQFMLMQLGGRFEQLVLHIWQRKYADEFDWQLEPQLKLLSASEQSQLLTHMAGMTRALLNLDASTEGLQHWLTIRGGEAAGKQQQQLSDIQRISFAQCNAMLLQQLPRVVAAPNIVQLQLGACLGVTPADLVTLFAQLRQLTVFELLPGGRNSGCLCSTTPVSIAELANVAYCQTLQCLKLPSCAVRATATEIARLPQLRQLTGFLCCSRDIVADADKGKANAVGAVVGAAVATATISACLAALQVDRDADENEDEESEATADDDDDDDAVVACQIVALNLQCQLDGSLLRVLQGHLRVLRLHRFAWHSQLMVHYDATDGSIKWLPQQPQVARALLHFIVSQAASLHELDFTRNVHATPTFLAQLDEHFLHHSPNARKVAHQLAVWHDGCPRLQMSNEQHDTIANCIANRECNNNNDLAFVHFELQHLANEKTICCC